MKRPFAQLRPVGPLFSLRDNTAVYSSKNDIQRVAVQLTSRVPSRVSKVQYADFFENPSGIIDFVNPSTIPQTEQRDYFNSSLNVNCTTGNITEMSIRFPGIGTEYISEDEIEEFINEIKPDIYRTRIPVDDSRDMYNPHIHYSAKKRGSEGPYLPDEISELNRTLKAWYNNIDGLFS